MALTSPNSSWGKILDAELGLWPASGHAPWIDNREPAVARIVDFFNG